MTKQEYLKDPCGSSSLPYWKAVLTDLPENMLILHERDFRGEDFGCYTDEPYFRLYHDLQGLHAAVPPDGFSLCEVSPAEYAVHINQCYVGAKMTEEDIKAYFHHSVYSPDLWLAVRENGSGKTVATGIAEFDKQVGEGILEWIQVSKSYRGLGLGTYIVTELLNRISEKAKFATVSGRINNPSKPESLYRKCGFIGSDVWHILKKQVKP